MVNRVFLNIFSNWANLLILIGARFFLTPFMIHQLGDKEYGIWILIVSTIGYMELLNMGMNTAVIRYTSKFLKIDDKEKVNEIFNTSLALFSALGIFILLLVLLLGNYFPDLFNFDGNYYYKIIFIIIGINLAFQFIFYVFPAVLSATHKFFEINIITTTTFLINTALVIIFLIAGYKLMALALIYLCTNLLKGILLSLYAMKTIPEVKFDSRAVKRDTFKEIFSYTFYNFLLKISSKINMTGSIIIIGYFLSAGAVTFYAIAMNLITYLHTLIMQIQRVLVPRFSELEAQNKTEQIQENFLALTRYTLIVALPIAYIFFFYGDAFIELWIGEKYASLSGEILAILVIGKIFHISQLSTETALKGISKHKNLSFLRIAESVSVLILSILLVEKYELIGIAYANAIPVVFFNLLVVPVYACNLLKIPVARYYLKYIFKNVLVIIPLFLIFHYINYPINSYSTLGLSIVSISIVFFVLAFVLVLDLKERKLVYSIFRIPLSVKK